ncbi:class I SAM-dependent methyltransferase [Bacteriovoracaceae bacterium]|nr:class I SAM-dependent methyltransferase [Bacteriovoracaceae bacterium]
MKNKCCICHSSNYSSFYRIVEGYKLLKCKQCNLIYLENIEFNVEDFLDNCKQEEKAQVEFWSVPSLYQKYNQVFDHFFKLRINRIKAHQLSIEKVLDIGTGYGFWAKYLLNNGTKYLEGLDIDSNAVKYCLKHYSIDTKHINFESYNTHNKFNAIFMIDVLEHFIEPEQMLVKAGKFLEEDGFIFIQVPNVIGFKVPFNHSLGLPYHLWQFDIHSLSKVINNSGFEVLEYWTGNQGIIGRLENGGQGLLEKAYWKIGNLFKKGNRLNLIIKKSL